MNMEIKWVKVPQAPWSPCLKAGIGMGYVPTAFAQPGTIIHISIREKLLKARVVKMPFYKQT